MRSGLIFIILALVALLVVFLTRHSHGLRDPRHAGIADNEDMQCEAPNLIVGDSNTLSSPSGRRALSNVPWRLALGMAPLRTTTRQPHIGVRDNSKESVSPLEAATLIVAAGGL